MIVSSWIKGMLSLTGSALVAPFLWTQQLQLLPWITCFSNLLGFPYGLTSTPSPSSFAQGCSSVIAGSSLPVALELLLVKKVPPAANEVMTKFLLEHLKVEQIGKVICNELPAVAAIHQGKLVEPLGIFYSKKYNKALYNLHH